MPMNSELATKVWTRYAYARDNGHSAFVDKVDLCERFFRGDQWDRLDLAKLRAVRRPALTINKIISTIGNIMGEQIFNRAETTFRPRSGAPQATADVLTKVFKQISDNNQLDWKRSDMFADGIIGSRGFLDVRLGFNDNMQGEVFIENLNPKNVIIDPDADSYDPDQWGEVFITKWMTADDIAVLYSKSDAELLRNRDGSYFPYGYDSMEFSRDRFGDRHGAIYSGDHDDSNVLRSIRVIERQVRQLHKQKHFMSPETGDTRPIPDDFGRDKIAFFVEKFGFTVITKLVRRIRWVVIADNVVLHDDWSPYKHFTVVPFFPHFRRGDTIGLVENLIGSQELLNKVTSQELHVVNTTANSGWKVKAGALTNMTVEELEEKGAQTGIVLELNDMDGAEKITPNAVPTGLDRASFKAEEHIKTISGVSDSMQGFDREDVAAKAIQAKRQAGSTNLVKPLDSLTRSDFILARNVLDIVQEHYTEERLMTITHDTATGDVETFAINEVDPYGQITNDLTLGEYGIVVSSVPKRETLEDSQFDQAVALKELGVAIPDAVLVDASRLINKKDIIKQMEGDTESPEAQQQKELALRGQVAEVTKIENEAKAKGADAQLKLAKAQKETQPELENEAENELAREQAAFEAEMAEREQAHAEKMAELKLQLERDTAQAKITLQQEDMAQKRRDARAQQAQAAAQAAAKPAPTAKAKPAKAK